ncbi:hypothetical protein GCM10010306_098950 [Streptomyces umbrinus]|nr:hypothetical protein GCM10010306_098950 [Streptomyces umbrinus]
MTGCRTNENSTNYSGGCGEGVKAVVREFVGRHVVPEVAGLRAFGQEVPDEGAELLMRPRRPSNRLAYVRIRPCWSPCIPWDIDGARRAGLGGAWILRHHAKVSGPTAHKVGPDTGPS